MEAEYKLVVTGVTADQANLLLDFFLQHVEVMGGVCGGGVVIKGEAPEVEDEQQPASS